MTTTSKAIAAIWTERNRQIDRGYTPKHDDDHASDEIAALACFYAMPPAARDWNATSTTYGATLGEAILPHGWAQPSETSRRDQLVKAGALIVAEIERLDRLNG